MLGSCAEPCWGKTLCRGAEQISLYPWKWKPSIGVGANGWEGHPSTTANSLEKIIPSSAHRNETAALAITDVICFMAMISFLVQKEKNALLRQVKSKVSLAARC